MQKPYVTSCKNCDKQFNWQNRKKEYCLGCKPNKKKQRKKYPAEFRSISGFIRKRDCYTCQSCHKNLAISDTSKPLPPVHHIDGNTSNNDTNNLVLLCNSCHRKIHTNGLKKFRVKKINIPQEKFLPSKKTKLMFSGI